MTVASGRRSERLIGAVLGIVLVAVAVSVALVGGRADGSSAASGVDAAGGTRTVAVALHNMRITPATITVAAGTRLVLEVTNLDPVRHDLHIDGGPTTPMLSGGGHAALTYGPVTSTVQGWCTVPGHRAAGMVMTIQVTGTGSSATAQGPGPYGSPMPGMAMPGMAMHGHQGRPTARIDVHATPGPDWKAYDPVLAPAPAATEHRLTFTVQDTPTEVAPGVRQTLWTYNGTAPGPILHGHVGDTFVITVVNHGDMAHGIDFHAGSVAPDGPMRSIDPGQSLTYEFTAQHSGAWLYHCSTMPMSLHIANGMDGAVIIDPPGLAPVDHEYALVQSELYVGPQDGTADEAKIEAKQPDATVFNGYVDQYDHAPISVRAGERIRVWLVDAGPQFGASFHVVGTQFDTVFKEGAYLLRPDNPERGAAQTLDLAPAQGGFVEFTVPASGHYPFIDHAMVDAEHGAHGIFVAR